MIPYADLERAIARWKLRQAGAAEAPVVEAVAEEQGGLPAAEAAAETSSGLIPLGDAEIDDEETV